MAVSFNYDTGLLSMWVDGQLEELQTTVCPTDYKASTHAYVNFR